MKYYKTRKVLKFDETIVAREYWYPAILTDEEVKALQEPKMYSWDQISKEIEYWTMPLYNDLSPISNFRQKRKGKMFYGENGRSYKQWEHPNGVFTVVGEVKEATPSLHDVIRYPNGIRALELITDITRTILKEKI